MFKPVGNSYLARSRDRCGNPRVLCGGQDDSVAADAPTSEFTALEQDDFDEGDACCGCLRRLGRLLSAL